MRRGKEDKGKAVLEASGKTDKLCSSAQNITELPEAYRVTGLTDWVPAVTFLDSLIQRVDRILTDLVRYPQPNFRLNAPWYLIYNAELHPITIHIQMIDDAQTQCSILISTIRSIDICRNGSWGDVETYFTNIYIDS